MDFSRIFFNIVDVYKYLLFHWITVNWIPHNIKSAVKDWHLYDVDTPVVLTQ